MKFDFKGGKDLDRALRELGDPALMRAAGNTAARTAMKPVYNDAKANIAKDTGETARSIKLRTNSKRAKNPGASVVAVSGSYTRKVNGEKVKTQLRGFIAFWLEFGTSKMAARPWLRPAFDGNARVSLGILGKDLWKSIARQAKKAAK